MNKWERNVKKVAEKYGYRVTGKTGGTHIRIDGEHGFVSASLSPKNPDIALRNIERDIKRLVRGGRG